MDIQALIFDVDGTVAETADLHRAAFNRAFSEHGMGWHWDREIFSQLMPVEFTLPKLQLFAMALERTGHAPAPDMAMLAKIAARKAHIFTKSLREGSIRLRPGVARLMQEARHEGLSLAIVSTSSRVETEALLTATLGFHALGWFSALKTADITTPPACERQLYRAVLDELGIEGPRAIAIDDSDEGITAAASCGLQAIATPSLYTASSAFIPATLVLSDLGQPAEGFTLLKGNTCDHSFISPALLRHIFAPNAAAA
ncbi:MAG: HAD hydrolase-like protein [Rhodobacteraceae bacterium]|nr:HAD hydrolase-like protein [Paracoccaceae bacterium]